MGKNTFLLLCLLTLAVTVLFSTGCKLEITAPEGGSVASKSSAYECAPGQVCTLEIYDIFFDEEFIAIPAPGYEFLAWKKADKSLCANKTTPCKIVSAWAQIHKVFMAVLESDELFYLEPVFIIDRAGTTLNGLTSQQLPIALTIQENVLTHVDFTYQQLGEIPPDPICQHMISVELSTPVNANGTFAVDVSLPPQTSDSGKLQLVAFDGRLSGSVGALEASGNWDFTELEIVCEKNSGETLRNFCGERFFPCIEQIDFSYEVSHAD